MTDLALGICIGVTATNVLATWLVTRDARAQLATARKEADAARQALTADVNAVTASTAKAIDRFDLRLTALETAETRRAQSAFTMPGVPRRS